MGAATKARGQAESLVGEVTDDPEMQARGKVREAKGAAQEFVGSVQETLGGVSGAVNKARRTITTTDKVVTGHPYAVMAASALFGLVVGMLMTRSGPKVIYVRPRT
jgi:uncharacterized protein YjbJ (UPF0337 family)